MLVAGDFPLNSTAQKRGAGVRDSTPMRWPGAPAFRAWKARALPVKLESGGVGEWLNPAVLKCAGRFRTLNKSILYGTYQYNDLARFGRLWQSNVQQNVQQPGSCAT